MKRLLSLFSLIIFSGLLLTGCTLSNDSSKPDANSKECFGIGKEITGNPNLKAVLTSKSTNEDFTERSFTLEETKDLQFGMMGEKGDVEYYGTYELCNLDTGEYLVEGDYVIEEWNIFEVKSNPNAVSESSGNSTSVIHTVEDEERNYIPGPGRYAASVFSATIDGDWKLADTIEFEVIE